MKTRNQALRWLAAMACAAALAACGGGGGGGSEPAAPPAATDSRNGDYVMYAGDAREYTLSLDFDAKTYRLAGNGQDLAGTLREANTSGTFDFDPASTGPAAPNAPGFTWSADTAVGAFRLPSATVPFIAARSFVDTLADAAGTYNFLETVRDTAAPPDSFIFTGELLASGTLRTCNDATIYRISLCPPGSIVTANVTVRDGEFRADAGGGIYPFRIAKVGAARVFLRASASVGTSRRLQIGIPERAFADGSFDGANTNGEGTATWLAGTTYNANWNDGAANVIRLGTVGTTGSDGPAGIARIDAGADGHFFAMHDDELLVLVSAHGNPTWPGYLEIGRK